MRAHVGDFSSPAEALVSGEPLWIPDGVHDVGDVTVDRMDWLGESSSDSGGAELRGTIRLDGVKFGRAQRLNLRGTLRLVNLSRSVFDQVFVNGQVRYEGDGEYVGDNLFSACEFAQSPNSPEPIVWLSATHGEVNENTWQRCRFQTNGNPQAPVVIIEHLTAGSYCYGNAFRDINFELAEAGGLHLFGCFATVVDRPGFYDAATYQAHPILLHRRPGGSWTKHTTIRSYMRASGSLAGGVYDVRQWDAHSTRIEQYANVQASGNRLSLNNMPAVVDGVHPTQVEVVGAGKAKVTTY